MKMKRCFLSCVTLLFLVGLTVPADALIIRDQCNQTSGDGQGHSCPPGDYALVRLKDISGHCGDWICCPANGNGTYNCANPVNPTRLVIPGALSGSRFYTVEGGTSSGPTKRYDPQNPKDRIMPRGVEGEQPAPSGGTGK